MGFRQNNKQLREAKLKWDDFCTTNREFADLCNSFRLLSLIK
jgi:hypothetical protein